MPGNPNMQKIGKRKTPSGQGQPDWLFPAAENSAPTSTSQYDGQSKNKTEKEVAKELLKRRAAGESAKSTPPTELVEIIGSFLVENEFTNTSQTLQSEHKKKGGKPEAVQGLPSLSTIYNEWRELKAKDTGKVQSGYTVEQATATIVKAKDNASSSLGSDSSEESEGSDVEMVDAPQVKEKVSATKSSSSSSSSSASSSSDSDADDEDEDRNLSVKPIATKAKASGLKRKASFSSDSSSSSGSDSDSSSEDDAPKTKKQKTQAASSSSDKSSSASESSSDSEPSSEGETSDAESSSSDSDSASSVEVSKVKKSAKPIKKAISISSDSDSSSSSSSSSGSGSESDSESSSDSSTNSAAQKVPLPASDSESSDSDSDSESESDAAPKKTIEKPVSSDTSATLSDAPKKSSDSSSDSSSESNSDSKPKPKKITRAITKTTVHKLSPPLPPTPVIKELKKTNVPFSRIPKDIKVDDRLASNAYVPYDYAQKAHEDLIVTKGKGFTKEKNKKKRGSYRGGYIDVEGRKGIKFED